MKEAALGEAGGLADVVDGGGRIALGANKAGGGGQKLAAGLRTVARFDHRNSIPTSWYDISHDRCRAFLPRSGRKIHDRAVECSDLRLHSWRRLARRRGEKLCLSSRVVRQCRRTLRGA